MSATLLPERSRTEENNTGSSSVSPGFQTLPITSIIHPLPLHPDPLQNEIVRMHKHIEMGKKMCEDKKMKIQVDCEQELEKVLKKYDAVLKVDELVFDRDRKLLQTICRKLVANRTLAEQFGCLFMGR